jgi:hypothetical protein
VREFTRDDIEKPATQQSNPCGRPARIGRIARVERIGRFGHIGKRDGLGELRPSMHSLGITRHRRAINDAPEDADSATLQPQQIMRTMAFQKPLASDSMQASETLSSQDCLATIAEI